MIRKILFWIIDRYKLHKYIKEKIITDSIQTCYKNVISSGAFFYEEARIDNLMNDPKAIRLGKNTHIRGELTVWPYGRGIEIGNNTYVGVRSVIRAGESIKIGDGVLIAHNVTIIDSDSHEIDYIERNQGFIDMIAKGHPKEKGNVRTAPIIIEDFVWISYNVSILKGVTVGKGAIVAAGAVVTKNVSPFTLVAGNPAKEVKKVLNVDAI